MVTISRYRVSIIALALSLFALPIVAQTAAAMPADLDPSYGTGGTATVSLNSTSMLPFVLDNNGRVVAGYEASTNGDLNSATRFSRLTPAGQIDNTFAGVGAWFPAAGTSWNTFARAVTQMPDSSLVATGYWVGPGVTFKSWFGKFTPPGTSATNPDSLGTDYTMSAVTALKSGAPLVGGNCGGPPCVMKLTTSTTPARDTTFGSLGQINVGGYLGTISDLATQSDGKVVAAGYAEWNSGDQMKIFVTRISPDGVPDPGFVDGTHGMGHVLIDAAGYYSFSMAVALQPDGKILVAGYSKAVNDINLPTLATLARLNPNGSLDSTFGSGGIVKLALGFQTSFADVAIQGDGKIVAVGDARPNDDFIPLIARYLPNGQPDTSFGSNGQVIGVTNVKSGQVARVAIQADGRIVVGESLRMTDNTYRTNVVRLLGGDPIPSVATISTPSKSKLKRKKFSKITGTATGDGLAKVEVAILKSDRKLLKKKRRCLQVSGPKAKFKKVKAVKKKCVVSTWLPAVGTTAWSYKLTKKLPVGKYTIYARATGYTGVQASLSKKSLKLIK